MVTNQPFAQVVRAYVIHVAGALTSRDGPACESVTVEKRERQNKVFKRVKVIYMLFEMYVWSPGLDE
jgi:hypothetical protein